MRLFRDAKYNFLESRRRAYVVSATLIVIGLISIGLHRGLNAGVEFTGGTLLQVRFTEQIGTGERSHSRTQAGAKATGSGSSSQQGRQGATRPTKGISLAPRPMRCTAGWA